MPSQIAMRAGGDQEAVSKKSFKEGISAGSYFQSVHFGYGTKDLRAHAYVSKESFTLLWSGLQAKLLVQLSEHSQFGKG